MKTHPEFGEVFGEWRLFEAARGCHQLFVTKRGEQFFEDLWQSMGMSVDFMNPRLSNTIVLQSMQHIGTSLVQTLYDGVAEEDLTLLLVECLNLCVSCQDQSVFVFLSTPDMIDTSQITSLAHHHSRMSPRITYQTV